MPSCSYPALLLIPAALLAACGGRTQLRASSGPSSGSGGSGPASTSASASTGGGGLGGNGGAGGDGGAGGAVVTTCVADGPPIGPAGTEGYRFRSPLLVSGGNGSTATLVAGWSGGDPNTTPPFELRHTTFPAWGAWPADGTIGPTYLADYDGGELFRAAPSPGGFGVFFHRNLAPSGLYYMSPIVPGSGALPALLQKGIGGDDPLFMVQGAEPAQHLFAFSTPEPKHGSLNLLLFNEATSTQKLTKNLACAKDPVSAGAAPSGDGYLVAFSSATSLGDPACTSSGGFVGLPRRLISVRVDSNGQVTEGATIEGEPTGEIVSVVMAPRSDGAWIAWIYEGSVGSPLKVARVDTQGALVTGPIEIPFSGEKYGTLSATSLGDHLALAWSLPAPGAPSVQVRVLDDAAAVIADAHFDIGVPVYTQTALLGAPSQKSLLVSWVEGDQPVSRLRVARLGCILP